MKIIVCLFLYAIFLALFVLQVQGVVRCNKNWWSHSNSCFRLYTEEKSWYDARAYCEAEGAHLATIKDSSTQRYLETHIFNKDKSHDIWIGLNDRAWEKTFLWDSPNHPALHGYTNWGSKQPNGGRRQNCGHIWKSQHYKWGDAECDLKFHFLCERPPTDRCKPPSKGVIQSYNYPTFYEENEFCRWTLSVEEGFVIKLVFQPPLRIHNHCVCVNCGCHPCDYDGIKVYEVQPGASKGKLKATYCYSTNHPPAFLSTTSKIVVEFKTTGQFQEMGFHATWFKVARTCGGIFPTKSDSGILLSNNYPAPYGNNEFCKWTINVEEGYLIKIIFTPPFDVKSNAGCQDDSVKIFDVSPDGTRTLKGTWCGAQPPPDFISSNVKVDVEFKSNSHVVGKGFSATWMKYVKSCSGKLKGVHGNITSLNYPSTYPRNLNCRWEIEVPAGQFVALEFMSFDLGRKGHKLCAFDKIEIFDVFGNGSWIRRGQWCGSDSPPVIKSFGHRLMVEFQTDHLDDNNGQGFDANWTAVNDCGGTYNAHQGYLMSYNYSGDSHSNDHISKFSTLNCTWEIDAPEGFHINLNFNPSVSKSFCEHFEVWDYSTNKDVFSLQPGWCDGDDKQIQHVLSLTHRMRLVYHGNENTNVGFFASWKYVCKQVLDGSNGTFTSPQYGTEYPSNLDCEWRITGIKNHLVHLEFHTPFEMEFDECVHDYVEIFDSMPNGTLVTKGRFCGDTPPPPVMSLHSSMVLRFHSDGRKSGKGFKATWDTACNNVYQQNQGKIETPNYPIGYPDYPFHCQWEIQVGKHHLIRLTFNQTFSMENDAMCHTDYVEIFDYSHNGSLICKGRWCGQVVPPPQISTSSRMLVVFHTDSKKDSLGFQAVWSSVCGEVFEGTNGYLSSPSYGLGHYPPDLDCEWTIIGQDGHPVNLYFQSPFELESSTSDDCQYDYLEVFDSFHDGTLISKGRFCGNKPPSPLVSSSSTLVVRFHSDHDKSGHGFNASWNTGCGGVYRGNHGQITSPGYPSLNPQKYVCRWEIHVDEGHVVKLKFKYPFGLKDDKFDVNHIWVYDVSEDGNLILIGKWTGTTTPPVQISKTSKMVVVFHSDKKVNGVGFQAEWEAGCHKVFTSPAGFVTSPGYPQEYDDNMDCTWEINVDSDHRIKVQFSPVFDIETHVNCDYDEVQVLDYFSNGTKISKGRLCGNKNPPVFISSSSSLAVRFHSDMDKRGRGFNASWETVKTCGNTFHEGNGFLMSPDYPSGYPPNLNCRWEIIPPSGTNVTLSFDALFGLEDGKDCAWDFVEIHRGNTRLGVWCGSTSPPSVVSHEKVVVVFVSDRSNVKEGFYASWTST